MLKGIYKKLKLRYAQFRGGETYLNYLRKKGVKIGKYCHVGDPKTILIDVTRPYLVEIGDNVRMNSGFTLLTHDFSTSVITNVYGDFIPSSGKVTIGNNVYFAQKCTVLKGVTIGNNCIIGYGSLINKDIPDNSVVAGWPAKVISSLDLYYNKRKLKSHEEALNLAREIHKKFNRKPVPADFLEEFVFFVSGNEVDRYPEIPIKRQLTTMGDCYHRWVNTHVARYKSFDDFLKAAGIYEAL